jgi:hypothetical protein
MFRRFGAKSIVTAMPGVMTRIRCEKRIVSSTAFGCPIKFCKSSAPQLATISSPKFCGAGLAQPASSNAAAPAKAHFCIDFPPLTAQQGAAFTAALQGAFAVIPVAFKNTLRQSAPNTPK